MKNLFVALSSLVALFHFGFMYLESYLWTKPIGLKIFRLTAEAAESSKVLALNQGFYNGILAAGIVWGLLRQDLSVTVFCLFAVVVAGLVGAATVSYRIFFIQALPAVLAILFYFLSQKASV